MKLARGRSLSLRMRWLGWVIKNIELLELLSYNMEQYWNHNILVILGELEYCDWFIILKNINVDISLKSLDYESLMFWSYFSTSPNNFFKILLMTFFINIDFHNIFIPTNHY